MQAQTKPKHRLFACAGKTRNAVRVGTGVDRPSEGAGSIVPTKQSCRVQTLSVGLMKPLGPYESVTLTVVQTATYWYTVQSAGTCSLG